MNIWVPLTYSGAVFLKVDKYINLFIYNHKFEE